MSRLKNSFIASTGLLALIAVLALFTPRTSRSQTDTVGPPKPVLVVNSPSEPVPITGTVNVGNLGNSPLPVRDVDNPARQPFQTSFSLPNQFSVPLGKRLVIEYVSGGASNSTACSLLGVTVGTIVQGELVRHGFIPTQTATNSAGILFYRISQETRLYADPGTTIFLQFIVSNETPCDPVVSANISGYLVDVP